jgi:IPTL-CTERM motif
VNVSALRVGFAARAPRGEPSKAGANFRSELLKNRVAPGVGRPPAQPVVPLLLGCVITIAALVIARPAHADLVVPANSVVNLASGAIDLACTDVVVAGTLQVASGSIVNARHVTIQAGGTIDGGSGTIALGGNWANAGQFVAGTSAVRFRDLCSLTAATISGSTTFSTASFVTATGRDFVFEVGATQTVNTLLEIAGTAALPVQFRSSVPGQVAYVNLIPSGTQAIQHVGVTDVWATGQWLAPTLTNEGGGGNANRWFGGGAAATPVPALADAALLALAALLAAIGAWRLRRNHRTDPDPDRLARVNCASRVRS